MVIGLCGMVASSAVAAPDNSSAVGQEATDFELVRLAAFLKKTKDIKAAKVIKWEAGDKVKLSSFRSKKPVVVVLASYT